MFVFVLLHCLKQIHSFASLAIVFVCHSSFFSCLSFVCCCYCPFCCSFRWKSIGFFRQLSLCQSAYLFAISFPHRLLLNVCMVESLHARVYGQCVCVRGSVSDVVLFCFSFCNVVRERVNSKFEKIDTHH